MKITVKSIVNGELQEHVVEGYEASITIEDVKFDLADEGGRLKVQKINNQHDPIIVIPTAANTITVQ